MGKARIAVTIDGQAVHELDLLVEARVFTNRSQAIEAAVMEKLLRLKKDRLARESAKLDTRVEQALAEEAMAQDAQGWPEY